MRPMSRAVVWLGLTLGFALSACDSVDPENLGSAQLNAPVALDDHVVFVDGTRDRAYLLDLSEARPKAETQRLALPPATGAPVRRNQHDEALVLCAGERGSPDRDAVAGQLVAIGADGKTRGYELGTAPFDTFVQSDDGHYAIVHRTSEAQRRAQSRVLDNPNELIVVDLDRDPQDEGAVTRKTPAGLGHTLTQVLVSPPMTIADEERRLLVVLSAAEVSLFDLGHLERRATIVQLDQTRTIDPVQVVFSADQPTLYVRASSSDNIFMFRFEPFDNDELGNDFQPSINPLSGGGRPLDMALFGAGAAERLMVLAERQALVIDPASSKTTKVPLPIPANEILLFEGRSPQDAREQTRALLHATGTPSLVFFDPQGLGDEPGDSVERLAPQQEVLALLPLLDENRVVLLQSDLVSVLDLEQRTLTPISASSPVSDALFDAKRKKLWVGPPGSPYIQSLDLTTGKTGDELRLDAPIRALLPMFERDRLVVLHEESLGYLTLVDIDAPDRDHALSLRGFFVNELFDRSEP